MNINDKALNLSLTILNHCWSEWPIRINLSYTELGVEHFIERRSPQEKRNYQINHELLEKILESLVTKNIITYSAVRNDKVYDASLTVDSHVKLSLIIEYRKKCQPVAWFLHDKLNDKDCYADDEIIALLQGIGIDLAVH
ncbi:hypothetical protein WH357_21670 [Enterobacter ludwigii]